MYVHLVLGHPNIQGPAAHVLFQERVLYEDILQLPLGRQFDIIEFQIIQQWEGKIEFRIEASSLPLAVKPISCSKASRGCSRISKAAGSGPFA
ncbi:hypothetical protein [Fodinicurvata halophila]|uniref:hypothetical protein n=1 Tax=Fodinicurvata halophila TaxID=1419723 RepID=UPI0036301A13